jgi:hypothetical protein
MQLQLLFWIVVAIIAFVVVPIAMIGSMVSHFRTRASERRGSGGISSGIGAAIQELDRLMSRPSVEHQVEAQDLAAQQDEAGTD